MTASEKVQPQKRGRPATGKGTPIQVRLQAEQLAKLDRWIADQADNPSRPEAVRRIIANAL